MKKYPNFFRGFTPKPPPRLCHKPIAELAAPQDTPPAFYNIQKLNLCSKRDISKIAWTNACTEYY